MVGEVGAFLGKTLWDGLVRLKSSLAVSKVRHCPVKFTLANAWRAPDFFSPGLAAGSAKGGLQAASEVKTCGWEVNLNLWHSPGAVPAHQVGREEPAGPSRTVQPGAGCSSLALNRQVQNSKLKKPTTGCNGFWPGSLLTRFSRS